MKSYVSKSVKSGFSELKNIAVELSSSCFSLLKSLAKAVAAGVSSIHSTTPYFKAKLHDQKIEGVKNDKDNTLNSPRPK